MKYDITDSVGFTTAALRRFTVATCINNNDNSATCINNNDNSATCINNNDNSATCHGHLSLVRR